MTRFQLSVVLLSMTVSPFAAIAENVPNALSVEWQGQKPCEKLFEDAQVLISRCTFPPGAMHVCHSRFAANSPLKKLIPVTLPPGLARLETRFQAQTLRVAMNYRFMLMPMKDINRSKRKQRFNGDDRVSAEPRNRSASPQARLRSDRQSHPTRVGEDRHQGAHIAASWPLACVPVACR